MYSMDVILPQRNSKTELTFDTRYLFQSGRSSSSAVCDLTRSNECGERSPMGGRGAKRRKKTGFSEEEEEAIIKLGGAGGRFGEYFCV